MNKQKNKKRRLTALAAAMFCFSANTRPAETQAQEIIVVDGDKVITVNGDITSFDDFNSNKNEMKQEVKKEDGIGSVIWPAALAVIGGVAGHFIGEAGSTKSMSNYGGVIGALIGGITGGVLGNKYKIKKHILTPVYNYFSNLFSKKNNNNNTKIESPVPKQEDNKNVQSDQTSNEHANKMDKILDDFVQPLVILRLFRYPEVTDNDNEKIMTIMLKCSHHYEFINSTVADFIINIRDAGISKSPKVICEELKNELLQKINISVTSYEAEDLKDNLKKATKELNSILKNLDNCQNNS